MRSVKTYLILSTWVSLSNTPILSEEKKRLNGHIVQTPLYSPFFFFKVGKSVLGKLVFSKDLNREVYYSVHWNLNLQHCAKDAMDRMGGIVNALLLSPWVTEQTGLMAKPKLDVYASNVIGEISQVTECHNLQNKSRRSTNFCIFPKFATRDQHAACGIRIQK